MKKVFTAKFLIFVMLINVITSCNVFAIEPEEELKGMLEIAKGTLATHPAVLELEGDIAVVGDIHGSLGSMQAITEKLTPWLEEDPTRKVLFLGDMFDRGNTTDTFMDFLAFFNDFSKGNKDDQVFVLRGNHETRLAFEHERISDARKEPVIIANKESIDEYMNMLPYAAVLNGRTLAVHGGIPGDLDCNAEYSYEQKVRDLFAPESEKSKELNDTPVDFNKSNLGIRSIAMNDLLWSDLAENQKEPFVESPRGLGVKYNKDALKSFFEVLAHVNCKYMNVKHIIRGHDHYKGPFERTELGDITHTTVISSLCMCKKCRQDHSSVALVSRDGNPQEFFRLKGSAESGLSVEIEDCVVKYPTLDEIREMEKKEAERYCKMVLDMEKRVKELEAEKKILIRKIPGVSLYRYHGWGQATYYGYLIDDKKAFEGWCEEVGIKSEEIRRIEDMQNKWLYTSQTKIGKIVADRVSFVGEAMKSWHISDLPDKFLTPLQSIKDQFTKSQYVDATLVTNITVTLRPFQNDIKSALKAQNEKGTGVLGGWFWRK